MDSFKRILVLSRKNITNYGDPIIGDCCKYLIEKIANEKKEKIDVTLADIYEENINKIRELIAQHHIIVFPGGGLSSIKFNKRIMEIMNIAECYEDIQIYFNAIGINRIKPKVKNEELLKQIFSRGQVKQVTTRGDYKRLKKFLCSTCVGKTYPCKLVLDPAVWVNEAYHIVRNPDADIIGVGVIRPNIFSDNGSFFSEEDVLSMYIGLIRELESRGYRWELFTNGMVRDYKLGQEILRQLGLKQEAYLGENTKNSRDLVEKISCFKAIVAARMHANIIATSLQVPSVGLVWNDKMNLFAEMIGCEERYINVDKLLDASYIVTQMEAAINEGYNNNRIDKMKSVTLATIENILK